MRKSDNAGDDPAASPKKKPRRAAPAAAAKKPNARPAAARRPTKKAASSPPAANEPQLPDQDTIGRMVAEAAYYLAEKRSFAPGYEQQDWEAAREQIAAQLRNARNPMGSTD